ncbi:MAG: ABC transporter ATP-binding protein/permease [Treponema sp.]|nr:ABC transporter ATP-binding protein/permease [Treponema sp.]
MNNKTPPVRKTGMARLWELAAVKKGLVVSSCALAVASTVVSFTPFVAIYFIIRALCLPPAAEGVDTALITRLGWLAAGGAVAAVLLNFAALMCSHIAAFTTQYKLKLDFLRHIAAMPLGFHSAHSTGKLRKVVDENIEKLESFTAHQIPDLAGSFALPVVTLILLLAFDWRLGLASLVPVILAFLIQISVMGTEKSKAFMKKYQDALEDMNNAAVEYVRGISVVKAFNQTVFSFRKFKDTITNYGAFVSGYTISFGKAYVVFMTLINHVYLFLAPVIILLSGRVADYGSFALSALFYLIFSMSIPTAFLKIMYVSQIGQQVAEGIGRMDKVLDASPLPETNNPKTANGYLVSFENITFRYNGKNDSAALSNVSFTAKQGEVTALVGPSGGGKSTLAHLLPRFYDIDEGAVKIGGVDIRDMTQDYLMSLVSFVFQDVFLFKQSIADNIAVGKKGASRAEIIAAACAAQANEFIEKLPQGYDTVFGSEGVHLSGGEMQRVVIARAILKDAPILALDEATAFADPENESKIQAALSRLMKNKTVIIIAHRLSTVRGADKIVMMDKGVKIEEGTHDALVNAGGRYRAMWEHYTGALDWTLGAETPREARAV